MKKSFVILLFFIALGAKAQGNLQFNQVLTYNGTVSCSSGCGSGQCIGTSTIWKVPLNKVWKVETKSLTGGQNGLSFYVNSTPYYDVEIYSYGGGALISVTNNRIIWLKSNDEIKFDIRGNTACGTITVNYFISIIEFNIVQ